MKSCSLSQIVSFNDVIFIAPPALNYIYDIFTVQVISLFTLKILTLKLYEYSSLMYLHSPHRGSLHFVTLGVCSCLFVNLAFVMPPTLKKWGGGHIGFGLSVCMYVRMYVCMYVFMFEISS